jgi:hypothetical protein
VILFQKQKKCKYGLPSQSSLSSHPGPHGFTRGASMHYASGAYDGTGGNDRSHIYDHWAGGSRTGERTVAMAAAAMGQGRNTTHLSKDSQLKVQIGLKV